MLDDDGAHRPARHVALLGHGLAAQRQGHRTSRGPAPGAAVPRATPDLCEEEEQRDGGREPTHKEERQRRFEAVRGERLDDETQEDEEHQGKDQGNDAA
ncbi:hypothetical protein AB1046_03955 [Promicromonospora sp. Populi]|uniref:hypothetical protein n=1 Tax=Promicromonospora sp. Populi TaxID=3239420 RepID=UPI0034E1E84A